MRRLGTIAAVAFVMLGGAQLDGTAAAQTQPINSRPNPYRSVENWAKMPEGRKWGASAAVDIDRDGKSIWVAERCGANSCVGSMLDPILKFDETGKLVRAFGAGMFVFPHGLYVDAQDNIWVTDGLGQDGKGHQVFKFSPEGKVLLTLGKAGVAGDGPDTFNKPSDVLVAPNGDIFVADGHGGDSNARIVKFSPDGKFIKSWGKKGTAQGEFDVPHCLAMDAAGRLLVCDRNNNRIQFFDQDGTYLDSWSQFSRPSSIWVAGDTLYVADSESESVSKNHDGWKRGIRIGSLKDGSVTYFIPDPVDKATTTSSAEGLAVDAKGIIYGAEVGARRLMRYEMK
jgi:sugar lactone lactonase YvrE